MAIQKVSPYADAAEFLSRELGRGLSRRRSPDFKIDPEPMQNILGMMCGVLEYMAGDDELFSNLSYGFAEGPIAIKTYMKERGLSVREFLAELRRFERQVYRDAQIPYDQWLIAMHELRHIQEFISQAIALEESVDVSDIRRSVEWAARQVCEISKSYHVPWSHRIRAIIASRERLSAAITIKSNGLVLTGSLILSSDPSLSLSVGGFASTMAGGLTMLLAPEPRGWG